VGERKEKIRKAAKKSVFFLTTATILVGVFQTSMDLGMMSIIFGVGLAFTIIKYFGIGQ